jgi:hypothetical protein
MITSYNLWKHPWKEAKLHLSLCKHKNNGISEAKKKGKNMSCGMLMIQSPIQPNPWDLFLDRTQPKQTISYTFGSRRIRSNTAHKIGLTNGPVVWPAEARKPKEPAGLSATLSSSTRAARSTHSLCSLTTVVRFICSGVFSL